MEPRLRTPLPVFAIEQGTVHVNDRREAARGRSAGKSAHRMCIRFWFIANRYPLSQQNQRLVANA